MDPIVAEADIVLVVDTVLVVVVVADIVAVDIAVAADIAAVEDCTADLVDVVVGHPNGCRRHHLDRDFVILVGSYYLSCVLAECSPNRDDRQLRCSRLSKEQLGTSCLRYNRKA